MENVNVMHTTESRSFIDKAKQKMEDIRKLYNEKVVDSGESERIEKRIDFEAKATKVVIGVAGTVATVALAVCPADGPFGEICTALATPGLCALVDLGAEMRKRALITGKRAVEKHIFKVKDNKGQDPKIIGYDLTKKELYQDTMNFIKGAVKVGKTPDKER